ncbi:UPF0158 family protein [Anthocerotibacter panamensis]|uniref:UPF0158 family protein n=1 Tax=Anthocerotibacter panamensis TaxID=2857077 RepID=UPI001C408324|nr:UPF0158 family protein [Anthocerotibacter panamensis]
MAASTPLPVDLDDLTLMMDLSAELEVSAYLDRQTGEILLDSPDTPLDIVPDEEAPEQAVQEFTARYLKLPIQSSQQGDQDMADFIETIQDEQLRERLRAVIHGRGAFSRFKDALSTHPEERARWFRFKDQHERERALQWLASHNIMATAP